MDAVHREQLPEGFSLSTWEIRLVHRTVERSQNCHEGEDDVGSRRGGAVARPNTLQEKSGKRSNAKSDCGSHLGSQGEAVLGRGLSGPSGNMSTAM